MKKSVLQPPERPNQSAFDRLRAWPVVFNVNQATRYLGAGGNDMASVYLARWKKSGMVQSTGPRSGVYFNLVANPKAAEEHLVDALLFAFPSAVLIGASVLHDSGWTTQIPSKLQIACLAERDGRRTVPVWDQVEFFLRPREWYQQFHGQLQRGESYGALGSLTPAAALVDAYLRPDGSEWQPDADDLDIPDECKPELASAWKQAGLDDSVLEDLLSDSGPMPPQRG